MILLVELGSGAEGSVGLGESYYCYIAFNNASSGVSIALFFPEFFHRCSLLRFPHCPPDIGQPGIFIDVE